MKPPKIDAGFMISILMKSNYAKRMRKKFGKERFYLTIDDGLKDSYIYRDEIYKDKIGYALFYLTDPSFMSEALEIKKWYANYLSQISPKKKKVSLAGKQSV